LYAFFIVNNVEYYFENDVYIYTHTSWTRIVRVIFGSIVVIASFSLLRLTGGLITSWKHNFDKERFLCWAILIVGIGMLISSITYSRPSLNLDPKGFIYETEALFGNEKYNVNFNDVYSINIDEVHSVRYGNSLRITVDKYSGKDIKIKSGNLFIIALPNIIRLANDAEVRI
jgi:hypothetical protein